MKKRIIKRIVRSNNKREIKILLNMNQITATIYSVKIYYIKKPTVNRSI